MTKTEAIAAVDAFSRDIASLSGPLMSWRHSPDALDRLAISALRDRVQSLAESMAGAPVEETEAVAVALDAVCAHDEYARDELAGRFRSAVRRLELVVQMRRHPRAGRFYTLIQAVSRGKATAKQMAFAREIAAEAA